MKRYFYITIHFFPDYEGTVLIKDRDDLYLDIETGETYRKRLLYDFGWGQESGYELTPSIKFDGLIRLVEQPMPTCSEKSRRKQTKDETEQFDIWRSNLYGAVAVIMQDYAEDFVEFLSAKVDKDYFTNRSIGKILSVFLLTRRERGRKGGSPAVSSHGHMKTYLTTFPNGKAFLQRS